MEHTIPVYHCRCCGKAFPSKVRGQISCPFCGREYYDVTENGYTALYAAVVQLGEEEARDFWAKNPTSRPIGRSVHRWYTLTFLP